MAGLRNFFLAVVCALALALPNQATADEYAGEDAGVLIFSVGNVAIPTNFTFSYKRIGTPEGVRVSDNRGSIECRCVGFFSARMSNVDYEGRERGKVIIRRLPPGQYEIYDFGFGGSIGMATTYWSSSTPFAIPFTITPGQATYIGNFARAPSLGTSLQPALGAAGFFVISDQSERDLAIARQKDPNLPEVTVSVADVSAFGHQALLTHEPE